MKVLYFFNVIAYMWRYQNENQKEPSEQRLQEISIEKNWPRAGFELATFGIPVQCSLNLNFFSFNFWSNPKAAGSNPAGGQFFEMLISCNRCSSGSIWLSFW